MKNIFTISLLLTCSFCFAQNLVPNGDFEQYSACPTNYSQLDSALYWINPANGGLGGTPDYYNQCATQYMGVPDNDKGFQAANSGVAYAGLYLYQKFSTWHEFIQVPLTSALISNTSYHFEMYVNVADSAYYTSPSIGVYFSDTQVSGVNNALPLPFTPQITNDTTNAFDALNWTRVSGNYTAHGGESFLIIGNFKSDAATVLHPSNINSVEPYRAAYVYIDDVFLSQVTGINKSLVDADVNIYPNPVTDILQVSVGNNEPSEIILYNICSQQILLQPFTNATSINTAQLAHGIYFYEIRNSKGMLKTGKIIKQ